MSKSQSVILLSLHRLKTDLLSSDKVILLLQQVLKLLLLLLKLTFLVLLCIVQLPVIELEVLFYFLYIPLKYRIRLHRRRTVILYMPSRSLLPRTPMSGVAPILKHYTLECPVRTIRPILFDQLFIIIALVAFTLGDTVWVGVYYLIAHLLKIFLIIIIV